MKRFESAISGPNEEICSRPADLDQRFLCINIQLQTVQGIFPDFLRAMGPREIGTGAVSGWMDTACWECIPSTKINNSNRNRLEQTTTEWKRFGLTY